MSGEFPSVHNTFEQYSTPEAIKNNPDLVDVSEEIREAIEALRQQAADTVLAPKNLYIQSGTLNVREREWIDKGCRGGWYGPPEKRNIPELCEVHTITITKAATHLLRFTSAVSVKISIVGSHQHHEASLDPAATQFYEYRKEIPTENTVDDHIKELLQANDFTIATPDELIEQDWQRELQVRAAQPFVSPVTYEARNQRYTPRALSGAFDQLESYKDDDGVAYVRIAKHLRDDGDDATPWTPLTAIEFYTVPRPVEAQLFRLAMQSINRQEAAAKASALLRASDTQFVYKLPFDVRRSLYKSSGNHAPFVLGRIAADHAIQELFSPKMRDIETLSQPVIRADEIIAHDQHSWVVDHTLELTTPVLRPSFERQSSWHTPVGQLIESE